MKRLWMLLTCLFLLSLPLCAQEPEADGYIVKFRTDISATLDTTDFKPINVQRQLYLVPDLAAIEPLRDQVEYYEPNAPVELIDPIPTFDLFSDPEPAALIEQWHLTPTNAAYAWSFDTFGNEVNVAVIDSGCSRHAELAHCLAGGYNYMAENSDYTDNHGHGTHVSGIIAANLDEYGTVGVAPKVKLYALKCLETNQSSTIDILATAIYDAMNVYDCKIINMSLGTRTDSPTVRAAVEEAVARGVIIVAAVGNKSSSTVYYPAGYEGVIGVGSVGASLDKSSFSQKNGSVFVVAPGERIASLGLSGGYMYMSGTSQATPQVAGLAAIMLSADPSMTAEDFRRSLRATSMDLGPTGYDTAYGYGLIDTKAMLDAFFRKNPLYLSPVNGETVLVYNAGETEQQATVIRAEYLRDRYLTTRFGNLTLSPKGKVRVYFRKTSRSVKCMLWDSMETMRPLTIVREAKTGGS